jgi:hypothetical protein
MKGGVNMAAEEELIGTIDFRDGEKIHVRKISNNGKAVLDMRVHVEKETYTGWSKAGLRLNAEQLKELKVLVAKVKL